MIPSLLVPAPQSSTPAPVETVVVTETVLPPAPEPTPEQPAQPTVTVTHVQPVQQAPAPAPAPRQVGTGYATFASPTGRIRCGIDSESASCTFPPGMNTKGVPNSDRQCHPLSLKGVSVTSSGRGWVCSGDMVHDPSPGAFGTDWVSTQRSGRSQSGGYVSLPYGTSISRGNFTCRSEQNGVACTYGPTGVGFRVALAGVTRIR